jgi:hypothetical protein
MRYRLRTLLILLAVGPPLLAWSALEWKRRSDKAQFLKSIEEFESRLGEPMTWPPPPTSFPEFANALPN